MAVGLKGLYNAIFYSLYNAILTPVDPKTCDDYSISDLCNFIVSVETSFE